MMKGVNNISIVILTILSLFGCDSGDTSKTSGSPIHFTILYTNDEHGWMSPDGDYSGAAGMMYKWKELEGYDESDNYLILSGGDMWSGPAISTWFQGQSMVEVMNAMDYDAAAIGNHEFDFTVDVLEQRLTELDFPLLASNIVVTETNEIPSFAKPYIIKEIKGIKVGIIGLATVTTPYSTFPSNVVDYQFTDYATAVDKYAAEAINDGAKVLIVIGHICTGEMNSLISVAQKYGISFIGGGHCHTGYMDLNNNIVLMRSGSNMRAYGKAEFDYSPDNSTTSNFTYELVENTGAGTDAEIQAIVDYWQAKTDEELSEQIGYTDVTIGQTSAEMRNMVCDSWLYKFQDADVALTNGKGIRQNISSGDITLGTIVGLLPFGNDIVELELTGAQLKEMSLAGDVNMGGMTTIGGFYLSDGTAIDDEAIYTVLTTDYLYLRNDYNFSVYDPDPVYKYTNYREPLTDWLKSINTSPSDPLTNYLDYVARR